MQGLNPYNEYILGAHMIYSRACFWSLFLSVCCCCYFCCCFTHLCKYMQLVTIHKCNRFDRLHILIYVHWKHTRACTLTHTVDTCTFASIFAMCELSMLTELNGLETKFTENRLLFSCFWTKLHKLNTLRKHIIFRLIFFFCQIFNE